MRQIGPLFQGLTKCMTAKCPVRILQEGRMSSRRFYTSQSADTYTAQQSLNEFKAAEIEQQDILK